jgi:hypothetical protein
MADLDNLQDGKNYYLDVPHQSAASRIKGSNALDWGMKNRLARIFDPHDARTVMLAIDHGYFQGPTTGLERIDVTIVPLISYADALMVTRGALRSSIPAEIARPVVLRSAVCTNMSRLETWSKWSTPAIVMACPRWPLLAWAKTWYGMPSTLGSPPAYVPKWERTL